jgi:glycosyltransferase involved in cell wall biosynthesis
LIPVYNRKHLIGPCIESALDQTMADMEVVIVDNASTDGTWEVCQEFASRDRRVRIFRNDTNIGPVRNWQRCFAEAKGKYGKILFSDDLMYPTFLEKTLPYMDDPEVGFVFSMAEIGSQPGTGQQAYKWANDSKKLSGNLFVHDTLLGGNLPVSPGAALFRLDDLRKNLLLGIPSPTMNDFLNHGAGIDLLLYLLTARSYAKVAYVDEPLVFFRSHPSSISIANQSSQINDSYTQTRIWFAQEYGNTTMAERCITWYWLGECRRRRTWVNPAEFVRKFISDGKVVITLQTIMWTLALRVKRKLSAVISQLLNTRKNLSV